MPIVVLVLIIIQAEPAKKVVDGAVLSKGRVARQPNPHTRLGLSGPIWTYLGPSGSIWAYLGLSGPLGLSEHIWAYLGLSWPIWAYLTV